MRGTSASSYHHEVPQSPLLMAGGFEEITMLSPDLGSMYERDIGQMYMSSHQEVLEQVTSFLYEFGSTMGLMKCIYPTFLADGPL